MLLSTQYWNSSKGEIFSSLIYLMLVVLPGPESVFSHPHAGPEVDLECGLLGRWMDYVCFCMFLFKDHKPSLAFTCACADAKQNNNWPIQHCGNEWEWAWNWRCDPRLGEAMSRWKHCTCNNMCLADVQINRPRNTPNKFHCFEVSVEAVKCGSLLNNTKTQHFIHDFRMLDIRGKKQSKLRRGG